MQEHSVPENIRKLSRTRALNFYKRPSQKSTNQLEPGQIWSTYEVLELGDQLFETQDARLIVILKIDENLIVAPISMQTEMASQYDLMVLGRDNPLGFEFMIEVWNEAVAIKQHLRRLVAELSQFHKEMLEELYIAYLLDEAPTPSIENYIGIPIQGKEDERYYFQVDELAAITYLSKAATYALESNALVNQVTEKQTIILPRPQIGKRREFLMAVQVARAADPSIDEVESFFIPYDQPGEELLLEVLSGKRRPYNIWLYVHFVGKSIQGKECRVILKTRNIELISDIVQLMPNAEIQLGQDPEFDPENVNTIVEFS